MLMDMKARVPVVKGGYTDSALGITSDGVQIRREVGQWR